MCRRRAHACAGDARFRPSVELRPLQEPFPCGGPRLPRGGTPFPCGGPLPPCAWHLFVRAGPPTPRGGRPFPCGGNACTLQKACSWRRAFHAAACALRSRTGPPPRVFSLLRNQDLDKKRPKSRPARGRAGISSTALMPSMPFSRILAANSANLPASMVLAMSNLALNSSNSSPMRSRSPCGLASSARRRAFSRPCASGSCRILTTLDHFVQKTSMVLLPSAPVWAMPPALAAAPAHRLLSVFSDKCVK